MRIRQAVALAALTMCWAPAVLTESSRVPLVDAVKAGDRQAVLKLLKQPDSVTAQEADGTTALHWAVRADSLDLAELLLKAGARANAANRYGVTPLALAAANGSPRMIDLLIENAQQLLPPLHLLSGELPFKRP